MAVLTLEYMITPLPGNTSKETQSTAGFARHSFPPNIQWPPNFRVKEGIAPRLVWFPEPSSKWIIKSANIWMRVKEEMLRNKGEKSVVHELANSKKSGRQWGGGVYYNG